jgi:hypothetical protein
MESRNKNRRKIVAIVAAGLGIFLIYTMESTIMDRDSVGNLTQEMKTACIGRFLIDIPASMELSYGRAYMNGFWISEQEESRSAFEERIFARQAEINSDITESGKNNLERIDEYSEHGFTGKLFVFGRSVTRGEEAGKPADWVNVKLEAYVHSEGTSFNFRADEYDADQSGEIKKLLDKLVLTSSKTVPNVDGFCFGRGMLVDPLPAEYTEGAVMFAGFRDHPDLTLAFSTRAGTEPDKEGRLARNARVDAEMPLWQKPLLKKIRTGWRTINDIKGEEVLERGRELNFVNVYGFNWEVNGTVDNVFAPFMHLEMSTGHPVHAGARPVPSFLGEEALVQLWDKISSSIRVRPTNPVLPTKNGAPPTGPRLGDTASAGEVCPGTGWWQCTEGGRGVAVLGGQRQFVRKGQRMPQALLLPTQTIWEKVRGVQSSFENQQPTNWTLLDRRSKARVETRIQLAPAIAQHGSARAVDSAISGTPAKVGSFVRTGTPCPASGWWHCQDSEALDGTRWFSQGDLLPAATFQIEAPKFRFKTGDAALFQRRSNWQLVRQTSQPDAEG